LEGDIFLFTYFKKALEIYRLESKISRILPQAERSSTLDERILKLEEQNNHLEKECRILKLEEQNNHLEKECRAQKNNFAASEGNLGIVRFERDEALQKVDLLEDDLKHLKGEYEKALTRSQDEMAMHERTRKVVVFCGDFNVDNDFWEFRN
jgi:hypothetical protein